jgi:hypothetical protein
MTPDNKNNKARISGQRRINMPISISRKLAAAVIAFGLPALAAGAAAAQTASVAGDPLASVTDVVSVSATDAAVVLGGAASAQTESLSSVLATSKGALSASSVSDIESLLSAYSAAGYSALPTSSISGIESLLTAYGAAGYGALSASSVSDAESLLSAYSAAGYNALPTSSVSDLESLVSAYSLALSGQMPAGGTDTATPQNPPKVAPLPPLAGTIPGMLITLGAVGFSAVRRFRRKGPAAKRVTPAVAMPDRLGADETIHYSL